MGVLVCKPHRRRGTGLCFDSNLLAGLDVPQGDLGLVVLHREPDLLDGGSCFEVGRRESRPQPVGVEAGDPKSIACGADGVLREPAIDRILPVPVLQHVSH